MKVDIQYPEELHELHNDLPFFPEIIKIKQFKKLATNYMIKLNMLFTWEIKASTKSQIRLKKVNSVVKFNKKAWLKLYIDMNTKLTQKSKNNFEEDFFDQMNNAGFWTTM